MQDAQILMALGISGSNALLAWLLPETPKVLVGARFQWPLVKRISRPFSAHPEYQYLVIFTIVVQVVTLMVSLIIGPAIWYHGLWRGLQTPEGPVVYSFSPLLAVGLFLLGLIVFLGPVVLLGRHCERLVHASPYSPPPGTYEVHWLRVYLRMVYSIIAFYVAVAAVLLAIS